MEILCLDHLEAECTRGYSNYHYSLILPDDICIATAQVAAKWNIPTNDPYYEFPDKLCGSEKGDDSDVDKVFYIFLQF